jgi:predicted transcriptional regulator
MATTATIGVKLDEQTRDRLKTLGERKERATHWLVKKAIEEYLAREEGYERERREDEERWQRYLETGAAVSNKQASAWLDQLAAGKRKPWRR